jgi:cbb3-type cytochrome oxidase maturation protein
MSVIVLLIIAGGLVAGGFLVAFVWAVRSGQFDDTFTPAVRVLLDAPAPGSGMRDAGSEPRTAINGQGTP